MVNDQNIDSLENESDIFSTDSDIFTSDLNLDTFFSDLNIDFSSDLKTNLVGNEVIDSSNVETKSLQTEESAPTSTVKKMPSHITDKEENEEPQGISRKFRRILNTCLILVALLLIGGIAAVIFMNQNADPLDNRILQNVSIAGVDVGGMTKEEALQAIRVNVGGSYFETDMVVQLGRNKIILPAAQTNANFNINAAVNSAFDLGRSGTIEDRQRTYKIAQSMPITLDITSALGLNTAYIRSAIENAVKECEGEYTASSYALEGDMPGLAAEDFDQSVPCQTLQLTVGTPGIGTNTEAVYNAVIEAYSQRNFLVEIPSEYLAQLPAELDLDAIYSELNVEPVEAEEKADTLEVVPGSSGYTFNLELAKEKLAAANYGEVITIPMEYNLPTNLDFNGSFTELVSSFTTAVSKNGAYLDNMKLLCKAIDKTVIEPGQTFSLNTISPRTEENGYKIADCHPGYCSKTELGGGSDQVASTLYVAALLADMSIVEKHPADHVCGFTTKGTEITVNQNWIDLKIHNDYDTPLKIRAKATGSNVVIEIYAQKAMSYYIRLETEETYVIPASSTILERKASSGYTEGQVILEPVDGAALKIYLIKMDKFTEQEISRQTQYAEVRPVNKTSITLIK